MTDRLERIKLDSREASRSQRREAMLLRKKERECNKARHGAEARSEARTRRLDAGSERRSNEPIR